MRPEAYYLLDFISSKSVNFVIPPYQRNYEWGEEQCKFFLEDIVKTAEQRKSGNKVDHFFGTLIFYVKEGSGFLGSKKLILTDGQQRITSAMLFIAAVRDLLTEDDIRGTEYDDVKDLYDEYNDSYLFNLKRKTSEPRLVQIEKDKETFLQIIYGEDVNVIKLSGKNDGSHPQTRLKSCFRSSQTVQPADFCQNQLISWRLLSQSC